MKYLLIENKGKIDVEALTLMGGTTKRNDNSKIGFYGSGNKYSIATLIKHEVPFHIFSGMNEIKVTTKQHLFRDTVLDKIFINDKETSLTVQMGPQWVVWQAIREIYSNSLDEGECQVVQNTTTISPREGYTRFYLEVTESVKEVVDQWDIYFTFDRTDCIEETPQGKIFPQTDFKDSFIVYRKGIRCERIESLKALYQYDLVNIPINESRKLDSMWDAREIVTTLINNITNKQVLINILENAFRDSTFENDLHWSYLTKLSPTFREAIGDYEIIPGEISGRFLNIQELKSCYIVDMNLAKAIQKSFPDVVVHGLSVDGKVEVEMEIVSASNKQNFLLKQVKEFFKEANYDIDYPIEIVKFVNPNLLGLAYKDTIWISEKQFEMGKKEIAMTIIEENEHLKTGLKDETRDFQNHFINMFLSQMEERIAHFL